MAIAQILKVATEVKDGTRPYRPVTHITLNARPLGTEKTNFHMQQISNVMGKVKRDVVEAKSDVEEVKCM
jgi:predicted SpoU family rRNA methylase